MKTLTKEEIINIPVPSKTYSYQPVSNAILLDTIEEKLYKQGLRIASRNFETNANNKQMFGVYELRAGNDTELINIGFRNSYDKSLAVGMVAGSTVIVCSNLMFKGEVKILRKHTNGVFNDLDTLIDSVVKNTASQFDSLQEDKRIMQRVRMSKIEMAQLAGRMFINESIVNSTQLSIIKKEIIFSEHFREGTKWDFYNHCTEALKVAHPADAITQHIKVHDYVLETV